VYTIPLYGIALVPLMLFYFWLQGYYRSTIRELKRLTSISASPILARVSETLQGVASIKAYCLIPLSVQRFYTSMDSYIGVCYLQRMVELWIRLRLDLISSLLIFLAVLIVILQKDSITASLAGLALSYAFQIAGSFNMCVNQAAVTGLRVKDIVFIKTSCF
jgi:ABC-type multidrug transport system fused ATPase/permease subunit